MWKDSSRWYQFISKILFCGLYRFEITIGRRIAIGYVDGSVKVFDLKTLAVLQHMTGGQIHTNAVSSIDCHRDNNLIVSGSLDSTAKLYNTQTGKVITSQLNYLSNMSD